MIGYLDTSVFVPLLVGEPSTPVCQRFWNEHDTIVSCRLTYVETAAALAQAQRMERLADEAQDEALGLLEQLWAEVDVAEIDEMLVRRAALMARRFALSGDDAVHCASAAQLDDDGVVAASGDQRLLAAWAASGMATFDSKVA